MKKWLVWMLGCGLVWAEESEYQFRGKHFIASYNGCDVQAMEDVKTLAQVMREAVQKTGAEILDESSYRFPGNGFTMTILLSESHASIHTYPEHRACFVDLFTCGERCRHDVFDVALREYLKPVSVADTTLIRDDKITQHKTRVPVHDP